VAGRTSRPRRTPSAKRHRGRLRRRPWGRSANGIRPDAHGSCASREPNSARPCPAGGVADSAASVGRIGFLAAGTWRWVWRSRRKLRGPGACVTRHLMRSRSAVACQACGACVRGHGFAVGHQMARQACGRLHADRSIRANLHNTAIELTCARPCRVTPALRASYSTGSPDRLDCRAMHARGLSGRTRTTALISRCPPLSPEPAAPPRRVRVHARRAWTRGIRLTGRTRAVGVRPNSVGGTVPWTPRSGPVTPSPHRATTSPQIAPGHRDPGAPPGRPNYSVERAWLRTPKS
jgi:hypothetical protein